MIYTSNPVNDMERDYARRTASARMWENEHYRGTCPFCGNEFEAASAAVPPQFQAQQQQQYGQGQPGGYAQGPQPAFTPPPSNDIFAAGPSGKSRGVAGLLAIFLGTLGVHYIYLDKTTSGIIIFAGFCLE